MTVSAAASTRAGARGRILYAAAGFGVLLGTWVTVHKGLDGSHSPTDTIFGGIAGFLFLVSGSIAHFRRPDNRVGLLMVLVGISWFAEDIRFSTYPVVSTLGLVLASASSGFEVLLVLAFPSGRIGSWVDRTLVIATFTLTFGVATFGLLFFEPATNHVIMPPNLLMIANRPELVHVAGVVVDRVGLVVAVSVVVVLVRRWIRATRPMRRVLLPVFGTGLIGAAASVVDSLEDYNPIFGLVGITVYKVAFCLLPLAFLAGLLRVQLGRTALDGLVMELSQPTPPDAMRDLLVKALRDPSLELGYWRPEAGHFVDGGDRQLALPGPDAARSVTYVESEGRRIAALIHDRALAENQALLDVVTAATALALENRRLAAEVLSQLAEVRASRARIVVAADAERRRVERDLHDGAQQRLVVAAMTLREAQGRLGETADPEVAALLTASVEGLDEAMEELRELARGIHPALLSNAGLGPALGALARRMPLAVDLSVRMPPLTEVLETTVFYVVAEALTNALKHARAERVRITVRHHAEMLEVEVVDDGVGGASIGAGYGLLGLRDRVSAVGGTLSVQSPAGAGTTLWAAVPC